jgi:hypothetical protein
MIRSRWVMTFLVNSDFTTDHLSIVAGLRYLDHRCRSPTARNAKPGLLNAREFSYAAVTAGKP